MSSRGRLAVVVCAIAALAAPAAASAKPQRLSRGVYEGTGHLNGGFSGNGATVAITGGGQFKFCAYVTKTGLMNPYKSHWAIEPTSISEQSPAGSGSGNMDAYGVLGGYVRKHGDLFIAMSGNERLTVTVNVFGMAFTLPTMSFDVLGTLPVDHRTPRGFGGDLALHARQSQQASGFSSTEKARYTAKRVRTCVVSDPPTNG